MKKKNSDKVVEVILYPRECYGKIIIIYHLQLTTEVEEAKKAHKNACLEATFRFNEVLAKKRFEFLERVSVYIQAQSTFFHQG